MALSLLHPSDGFKGTGFAKGTISGKNGKRESQRRTSLGMLDEIIMGSYVDVKYVHIYVRIAEDSEGWRSCILWTCR